MATAFIDPTTGQETTRLQSAIQTIDKSIEFTTQFLATDEMGIVLYGTEETNHDLDEEAFPHITTFNQIERCSLAMLTKLSDIATTENTNGDAVKAVSLALELIKRRTKNKKFQRHILLLTDCGGIATELEKEEIDRLVGQAQELGCTFKVVGLGLSVKPDPGNNTSSSSSSSSSSSNTTTTTIKEESSRFALANTLSTLFCNQLKGSFTRPGSVQELLGYVPRRKRAKTKTYKHTLSLTPELQMKIHVFKLSDEERFPSAKKKSLMGSDGESGKVDRSTTYKSRAGDVDEEIKPENLVNAYRYGKELVPFSSADKESMKYESKQCMQIIGFVERSKINRAQFLGGTDVVLPDDGDNVAATAMSALIHAMQENDVYAIARYVVKDHKGPRPVCLSPYTERSENGRTLECLVLNTLPFADDLRPFRFKSLSEVELSKEQESAADALIDAMDLSIASTDGGEALVPRLTYNPTLQYFYASLSARARDPDAVIVPPEALSAASFSSSSSSSSTSSKTAHGLSLPSLNAPHGCFHGNDTLAMDLFKKAFPTVLRDTASKKKRHWGANKSSKQQEEESGSTKGTKRAKTTSDGEDNTDSLLGDRNTATATFIAELAKAELIGTAEAAQKVFRAMKSMIESVVFGEDDGNGSRTKELVVSMLTAFRKCAKEGYEESMYNSFAHAYRARCTKDCVSDAWLWMVETNNGLISEEEAESDGAGADKAEVTAFLADISSDNMSNAAAAEVSLDVLDDDDDDDMDLE